MTKQELLDRIPDYAKKAYHDAGILEKIMYEIDLLDEEDIGVLLQDEDLKGCEPSYMLLQLFPFGTSHFSSKYWFDEYQNIYDNYKLKALTS